MSAMERTHDPKGKPDLTLCWLPRELCLDHFTGSSSDPTLPAPATGRELTLDLADSPLDGFNTYHSLLQLATHPLLKSSSLGLCSNVTFPGNSALTTKLKIQSSSCPKNVHFPFLIPPYSALLGFLCPYHILTHWSIHLVNYLIYFLSSITRM